MVDHWLTQTLPIELAGSMASYYREDRTVAIVKPGLSQELADLLGIDLTREPTLEEQAGLILGMRTDGAKIPGKTYASFREWTDEQTGVKHESAPVAYIDVTFSAPKSWSIAWAKAPTEYEREVLFNGHWLAALAAMGVVESKIGVARRGAGGLGKQEKAELAWMAYHHYASRATIAIPVEKDGVQGTELITMKKAAGDMQLHTHFPILNCALTETGHVGSFNLGVMKGFLKEAGAIYHAFLGNYSREHGIEYVLDSRTGLGKLFSVPDRVVAQFSKRTTQGNDAARKYAADKGLDWDTMSSARQRSLVKEAIQGRKRYKTKEERDVFGKDDLGDLPRWNKQFAELRYEHRSVLRPNERVPEISDEERLERARDTSMQFLQKAFTADAVVDASVLRQAAAKGLIPHGIKSADDVDKIVASYHTRGIVYDGELVPIHRAKLDSGRWGVTTGLHASREAEFVKLAAAAHSRSAALPEEGVERAIADSGLDFTSDHGKKQLEIIRRVAFGSQWETVLGVGGAGKTAMLLPLVDAWQKDGRRVFGLGLAWRYAKRLRDAGIADEDSTAIKRFIARAQDGKLQLDRNSVVVIDELSTVSTKQSLALARLQERYGFQILEMGDDKQTQGVEAGPAVDLRRLAFPDAIPEILSTIRQFRQRDRETTLMFRDRRTHEALSRMREDGDILIVPGEREHAIKAAVAHWESRRNAARENPITVNGEAQPFTIGISDPTNIDAREIGAAIRARKQVLGEIGADQVVLKAADQSGVEYDLPLAAGDNVRLFDIARSSSAKGGVIGWNGSVVEVLAIKDAGMQVRAHTGSEGFVKWDSIKDQGSGRVRLVYGDAVTLDARTGDTSLEHITVLASGSHQADAFNGYMGLSRSRMRSFLIVSQGEEKKAILRRRGTGDTRQVTDDDVINEVARNLARQNREISATELLRGQGVHWGNTAQQASAPDAAAAETSEPATEASQRATEPGPRPQRLTGPRPAKAAPQPVQKAAKRASRKPANQADAVADFADALRRAGLVVKGPPLMDGKLHRVPVEGDKRGKRSGAYVGHSDGIPAGYAKNHKTGDEVRWKADTAREMDAEARAAAAARIRAAREEADRQNAHRQEQAALRALRIWNRAKPARADHPYLAKKGVGAHGLRQNERGELLVPMRDLDGNLRNVQTIHPDGRKLYLRSAQKSGMHMRLGEIEPGKPLLIGEGFATLATLRESTSLTAVVAFDSGGILPVAKAYRARYPDTPIVIAADNDHHLPRHDPPLPNVGIEKAKAAALAVNGVVLAPEFAVHDKGTDWNDFGALHGKESVQRKFAQHLKEQGMDQSKVGKSEDITQAQRDAARAKKSVKSANHAGAQSAAQAAAQRQQSESAASKGQGMS